MNPTETTNPGAHGAVAVEKIAVIGLAGRFPGAANIHQFWANLCAGVEARTTFTDPMLARHWPPELWQDPAYVKVGFVLDQVDHFDADFFAFTHRQAQITDPQQRIFLECVWEALETAGIDVTQTEQLIGVYAGASQSTYATNDPVNWQGSMVTGLPFLIGNDKDYLATQTAYRLNLQGPSMTIQSACSTGLVATHVACQSLLNYECDVAIAGGVTVRLPQERGYLFEDGGILAADGHCRAFDAAATGTVFGNGAGVVVLKRLEDALAAGDPIWAVIRGSAVNNDGARKFNFTTSSAMGQYSVISEAWSVARVTPDMLTYIETHGTGTQVGDPIEVNTLASLFGADGTTEKFCAIGSVKTNVGHLESAAGITGLLKTVLALHHRQIPPSLNYTTPNPEIEFAATPLYVNTTLTPWETNRLPRCAGVSSFGIGGTNAHVVLEEAPARPVATASVDHPCQLLTISAKSATALRELTERYLSFLTDPMAATLGDICYTSRTGRAAFDYRLAVTGATPSALRQHLAAYLGDSAGRVGAVAVGPRNEKPQVAFLFTGQGSQYVGMGRELYETQPVFRTTLDRCDAILQACLGRSLLDLLYPATPPEHNDLLDSHPCGQAANFALECALVDLWRSWGIQPAAVLGHSLGDFAAAYTAGVLSLEDGLRLVSERGRLMERAQGSMVAVLASEAEVAPLLAGVADVTIGVINGPRNLVLSGGHANLAWVTAQLQAAGFKTRPLNIPVAAHSPMLDPVLDAFEAAVRQVKLSKPQLPVVSSMTGQLITDELTAPTYWRRHLRNTVRFADGVQTLANQGCTIFLEIGPKPTLLGMAEMLVAPHPATQQPPTTTTNDLNQPQPATPHLLPSLRENTSDWQQMLTTLGALYTQGVAIDWSRFDQPYARRKVTLPTYPFQRQRYWVTAQPPNLRRAAADATSRCPLVDRMIKLPRQKQILFESAFSVEKLPFLADHQIFGSVIAPGACHLALVLRSADLALAPAGLALHDVLLPQALVLADGAAPAEASAPVRTVQLLLTQTEQPQSATKYAFVLSSFDPATPEAEPPTHVMGSLTTITAAPDRLPLADLHQGFTAGETVDLHALYGNPGDGQIVLGPSFQWLTHLQRREAAGRVESLGALHLPPVIAQGNDYLLHPGLLDACLQVANATTNSAESGVWLPFALRTLRFYKPTQPPLQPANGAPGWWCHAVQIAPHQWDLTLYDAQGAVLLVIEGFEMRQATAAAVQGNATWRNWLYQVQWQPRPLFGLPAIPLPAPAAIGQQWLAALSPLQTTAAYQRYLALSAALETVSIDYVVAALTKSGFTFHPGAYWSNAQLARQTGVIPHYQRLLARLLAMLAEVGILTAEGAGWRVALAPTVGDPQSAVAALQATYGQRPELTLLARCGAALSEVLRGAQEPLTLLFAGEADDTVKQLYHQSPPMQAANTLLQQAIQQVVQSLPAGQGLRILEIGAGTGSTTAALLPHLPAAQIDYLFTDIGASFLQQARTTFAAYPFVRYQLLDIERPLHEQGFTSRQADLIVAANVLHATRNLSETLAHTRQLLAPGGCLCLLESTTPNRFVDLTFGLTDGWWRFADQRQAYPLLTDTQWSALLQEHGFTQVATTAIDGQTLIIAQVAAMATPAPSVNNQEEGWLIFADAGGVGAALATQLTQRGADVTLVYAGAAWEKQEPRRFVINPGQAADYQRLFAAQPVVTQVVHLWSLDLPPAAAATDLLAASQQSCGAVLHLVQTLLHQQIRPTALWLVTQNAQPVCAADTVAGVAQAALWGMGKVIPLEHPELNCRMLDLADLVATTLDPSPAAPPVPALLRQATLLCAVMTATQPVMPAESALALRHSEQGATCYVPRLSRAPTAVPHALPIVADATYLITGGFGGIGLAIAQWLAEQGARHLVLVGRSQPKAAAQPQLDRLGALGVHLTVAQVDVTNRAQLAACLAELDQRYPLRGVIHAVGVLDDGALLQQEWERFERVLAPKVQGAWHLHQLTQACRLDFFVLFSSAAGLLGNRGQANHAAANAFLDALAHYRQAQQLPALSIDWGGWSDIGDAAELVRTKEAEMAARGMGFMTPAQGVAAFGALLAQSQPQVAVLPITWSHYSQTPEAQTPFYAELAQPLAPPAIAQTAARPVALRQQLEGANDADRKALLVTHLQETVAQILGMTTRPSVKLGFTELGMDSLMAIELRRQLEKSLQVALPATVAFEYPTTDKLAAYLLAQALPLPTAADSTAADSTAASNGTQPTARVQATTDDATEWSDQALLALVGQAFTDLAEEAL